MEERLELLQRQQPFPSADVGLVPDSDYLEVARTRSECSDHSSPNVTPRASNHSNLSVSELGSSANEHDEGGMDRKMKFTWTHSLFVLYQHLTQFSLSEIMCLSHQRTIPVLSEWAT